MLRSAVLVCVLVVLAVAASPTSVTAQQCTDAGTELSGALCYPRCDNGYYGVGPVCWQYCRSGYADHGATCYKSVIPPDFYAKHSYGRGVGTIPDWSARIDEAERLAMQVGNAALDAGRSLIQKVQAVDPCKVGLDLARGVNNVLEVYGDLYREFGGAQDDFVANLGLPNAYIVDYRRAFQTLQPGLDNLLRPAIAASANFENTLMSLREQSQRLTRIPADSVLKAACGDPTLRGMFEQGLMQFGTTMGSLGAPTYRHASYAGDEVEGGSAVMRGWVGLVITFLDVGAPRQFGTPNVRPNMQHTFGFMVKPSDGQKVSFYSLSVGVMVGSGLGANVRMAYIPFDVDRETLLGPGWSISSAGIISTIFQGSLAPIYSRRATAGLSETMEFFGNVDSYVGMSLGPQVSLSNASADITFSYTHTLEINAGPPRR